MAILVTVTCDDCGRLAELAAPAPNSFAANGAGRYLCFWLPELPVPAGWGRINSLARCDACEEAHRQKIAPELARRDRERKAALMARSVEDLLADAIGYPANSHELLWAIRDKLKKEQEA